MRKADGLRLANQYSTVFAEVSAADGRNIESAITEMAKLLKDKFYTDLQRGKANAETITLEKNKKKKNSCCTIL